MKIYSSYFCHVILIFTKFKYLSFFDRVPLSSLYLSLTQTGVPLTHVLAAMNGNIVALCGYDPSAESNNSSTHSSSESSQVLIRTPLSTCYGFGENHFFHSLLFNNSLLFCYIPFY